MISEAELMFQLGAIMLLAFIAATLAGKINQTVMIGYIIIGVLVGPKIRFDVLGFEYTGLITDTTLIDLLSSIGLIMLMFFVGLEFSFSKLKRTKTPAIILAIIDTSVGLFVGFTFASYLGWPLIDSVFLAGVVAMSSTSIAMKVLFDLKRMSSPEVEFLIGLVVVETFIAMVILTVASGMIVDPEAGAVEYGQLIIGMVAFYAFFVWIAMWAVPRVVKFFSSIDNDELFILFVLGVVFLTSGIASLMNVPPIIGAFFIGMVLAETKVTTRIQTKLESFKDAFVAVFFTAFGMMIDPAMFGSVMWMIALAIPVVVLYEAFVMSSVSYFVGFSPRASATIGTSMCGRGVESILYASVGSRVKGATMGGQLNAFAGVFCFIMSALTPPLVKHSAKFANIMSRAVPKGLKFSASVMSRTLGKAIMPASMRIFKGARITGFLLMLFVMSCVAILLIESWWHILATAAGVSITVAVFFAVRYEVRQLAVQVNYSNLGVVTNDRDTIVSLVSGMVIAAIASVLLVVTTWTYMWQFSLAVVLGFFVYAIVVMMWAYRKLYVEGSEMPRKVYDFAKPAQEGSEPMAEIPKPVYGVVRTTHRDTRL